MKFRTMKISSEGLGGKLQKKIPCYAVSLAWETTLVHGVIAIP